MTQQTTATRVTLGRSGLEVSPICFGTWQLSPKFWGDVPADDCIAAMRRAFELGVNFYDTADAYGEGYSEEIVGKALKDLPRDEIVVATKVFHHWYDDGHRHGDLSKDYIIEECEASLKRLGMDTIDLYQCHSWDPLTHPAETAEALEQLKQQGKIRAYGHSNWNAHQIDLGDRVGDFATNQPYYSLIRRDIEDDVLPACMARDIGVLVFSPLHRGLLAGKYTGSETFDDLRANDSLFKGEKFKSICAKVKIVGEIGAGYGLTTVQTVLAATIMHPGIHCAITGIKRSEQIEEAAGAMGKTMSRDDYYKIRSALTLPKD
jgi:aryl-alcohol dehydrogenase-like predicted oxidoreductase